MQITTEACEFVHNSELKSPVILIFEQEYKGWCGTRKVTNVTPVESNQVSNPSQYAKKCLDNCDIPVLIEENLITAWDNWIIDLAGWATFQRLMLYPNKFQSWILDETFSKTFGEKVDTLVPGL